MLMYKVHLIFERVIGYSKVSKINSIETTMYTDCSIRVYINADVLAPTANSILIWQ